MSTLRIGELFAGYGGLGMGVQAALGGELAWVSEIDKGALKILTHRFPDVPNIGDITAVDWSQVEPVDILTAGFPCQPVSNAGKRLGDNDERWLWDDVARAVRNLRPRLVVLENVRGLLTAGSGRLFGRVLGALADLGYDASWHGLRAADVGAPHGRFRIFILAWPAADTNLGSSERWERATRWSPEERVAAAGSREGVGPLLPTPAVNDMGAGKSVDDWDDWTERMKAEHGNGNGHGKSLAIEAQRLLPTPRTMFDAKTSKRAKALYSSKDSMADIVEKSAWGEYAPAIARWDQVIGRPAPAPTQTSTKGNPQLAPAFVEFLMGLPAGWVADAPGITRNEALKALGNGVVPQQAEAAVRYLLDHLRAAA